MKADVVIVGGGPGGATAALSLAEEGFSSVIVEKEDFPRFHIGESMTGECGSIVRRLGLEGRMAGHPVKHATDVYGANGANKFRVPVMSPSDDGGLQPSTTWQVRRSEFDAMLLDAARERDIEVVSGTVKDPLLAPDGSVTGVEVEGLDGQTSTIEAAMILDASGRATWGSRVGLAGSKDRGHYASQTAVFTHVKGAARDDGEEGGNTIIFYSDHLHWAWFIPLDDEVTSVGVVASNDHLKSFDGELDEYFEHELENLNPELARRVTDVIFTESVQTTANFSYEIPDYVAPGYVAIGDAHRFIDPIFSFGLYVAMAEAEHAAATVVRCLRGDEEQALEDHRAFANRGQSTLQHLVDGFWANPLAFGYMVHQSQYSKELIDIFAGRIYNEEVPAAVEKLATLASQNGQAGSGRQSP